MPKLILPSGKRSHQQNAGAVVNWNHPLLQTIDDVFIPTASGHIRHTRGSKLQGYTSTKQNLTNEFLSNNKQFYTKYASNANETWPKSAAYWSSEATLICYLPYATSGDLKIAGICGYYDDGLAIDMVSTGRLSVIIGGSYSTLVGDVTSSIPVCISATYKSGELRLYKNGTIVNSSAPTGNIAATSSPFTIGALYNQVTTPVDYVGIVLASTRYTTQDTITKLAEDPSVVFVSSKRKIYFRLPNGTLRVPFTTAAAATDNIYLDINNNLQLIKSDGTCKAIAVITE